MRVSLDQVEEFFRPNQNGVSAERSKVFDQRINIKCLTIGFFRIVQHAALAIELPECAAVFGIPKPVHHEVQGAVGHLPVQGFWPAQINGRKRPENAAVDDQTFGLTAVGFEVVGQTGHPAALRVVERGSAPERHDVPEQLFADAPGKIF